MGRLLVLLRHREGARRGAHHLLALSGLEGRQGEDQIVPARLRPPQGLELLQGPVVGGEQVVEQIQLPVSAVPEAFFISVMVVRR